MTQSMPAPLDVRLMNISAAVLGMGVCVAVLMGVAGWVIGHPAFSITRIIVQGETVHNNDITLRANVTSRLQGNFFTLDLTKARNAFEAVPWVRKVTVRREFPDRLVVKLEEHRSAGFWGEDSDSKLVNTFGEVFEANIGDVENEELPRLIGPDGQGLQVLEMYRRLQQFFTPLDASIETLSLTGRGGWRLQLDTGAVFEMGRGSVDEVAVRMLSFIQTHTQVLAAYQRTGLDRVESVDLRHNGGYAIRLRGVTTTVSTTVSDKK
jgi:cell division protein FtsQ